jgi:hypothetical protein
MTGALQGTILSSLFWGKRLTLGVNLGDLPILRTQSKPVKNYLQFCVYGANFDCACVDLQRAVAQCHQAADPAGQDGEGEQENGR